MTVAELIKTLKKFDSNNIVLVEGYESGFVEAKSSHIRAVRFNKDKDAEWWEGKCQHDRNGQLFGVVISR